MNYNLIVRKIIMRTLVPLLIISLATPFVCAENSYGQTLKESNIRYSTKEKSVADVFSDLSKQTGFNFFYDESVLHELNAITINVKDGSIDEILDELTRQTGLQFKKIDNTISVSRRQPPSSTASLPQQQSKRITGIVTDEKGEPIIGANVVEKGTTNGTVTDFEGKFSLITSENSEIQISYIGYILQEVTAKNGSSLSIALKEDSKSLDEVVVVGYGTQKKVNLTGSVTVVSIEELGKRQVGSTSLALQGLAPGVVVTQRSGQPGADGGIISIRGKTTMNNNDALILVDGVEMGINTIDASMIESISILKDASSSAIYGSRAANGVILITTRRAKADQFMVSYSGYTGWQSAIDKPAIVGAIDHMTMTNIAYANIGKSPLYSESYINEYKAGMASNPDKYPDTNWIDETMTNNGLMQNHFLTISGGSSRIRTVANFGYFDQNGIIENSNYKRYTFRINSDMDISKNFTAKIDGHVSLTKRKEPSRSDAFHWMSRIPSMQAGVLSTGQWGEGWNGDNPIAFTNDGGLKKVNYPSATMNFNLIYTPAEWLTLQGSYSPSYSEEHVTSFNKIVQTYKYDGTPYYKSPQKSSLTDQTNRYLRNLLIASATFDHRFGAHGVKVLAGYQQEDQRNDGHSGYRENFTFPEYPVLSSGGEENQKAYGWASEWALQSYFGRVNYDFEERYLFEANVRYDGSSRFAKGNKWGVFPSFSLGWRLSEEVFWESLKGIANNLKLRASWGQLGNQNIGDNYPFSSNVDLSQKYVSANAVISGAAITQMANTAITWETTTVTDIGLDATLFNKLNLTVDYFYKKTDDILLKLNVPLVIGMSAPQQNAGKVENRGWEAALTYTDKVGDFNYRVSFNISDVKNKILDLKGIDETGLTVNREGEEMYSLYGLEAVGYIQPEDYDQNGVYQGATQYGNFGLGDIKYKDQNDDGVINTSDRVIIGTTIPRYTFGLSLSGEYKGFDLNLLVQGVGKADGYLNGQGIQPFYEGGTVQEQHKNYWTENNRKAAFPRLAFNETNNIQNSSFWKKNAAYARLKNIQLGYSLPQRVLKKTPLSRLRFYVSGDNLLTLDKFWDGFDVEAPVGNGGYYPQLKVISFGLDINF